MPPWWHLPPILLGASLITMSIKEVSKNDCEVMNRGPTPSFPIWKIRFFFLGNEEECYGMAFKCKYIIILLAN